MNNERGGIISKLFIIPIGVALMVGFFFLGYYVGKYQSKPGKQGEFIPQLPEIVSKNLPDKEEFTFYKTLTDKNDKTVSIDLKPRSGSEAGKPEKKPIIPETPKPAIVKPAPKEKKLEITIEKDTSVPTQAKQTASKQQQTKKEPAPTASSTTLVRYTLQLASYQDKETADSDVKKMKKRGYAAFIVSAELPGKGMWHRVRLGSFSNKASAEKLQKEIRTKEGLSPIVVTE